MRDIVERVEGHKEALTSGRLFKWLSDESIDGRERLSFAPSMLYYLMGFKDVLGALQRQDPKTEVERQINAYCGEDAEHWRWYLSDLEKLGYGLQSWGESIPAFCNEVWSPTSEVNRKTIFQLLDYAKRTDDPLVAMALIQVFEATGVVFIGHTRKAARALKMDDELLYFGRIHFEEEFGHSVQARDLLGFELCPASRAIAREAVEELFKSYDVLFDCWYEHRNKFRPLQTSIAA